MEIAVGEFVYSKQHELGAGAQGAVYKGHYMVSLNYTKSP